MATGPSGLAGLRAAATSAVLRDACDVVSDAWRADGDIPAGWVAGAIAGAAVATRQTASRASVDVVWTGPESDIDTGRLTAPTVKSLIDGARQEIWMVSFASRNDEHIGAALAAAVERGVDVNMLLERTIDNPTYTSASDAYAGLRVRRLVWPAPHRRAGASLHAKLIVVDRTIALVGSANLTGRAMTDNLECGVLLHGGPEPPAMVAHLESLLHRGTLTII